MRALKFRNSRTDRLDIVAQLREGKMKKKDEKGNRNREEKKKRGKEK